MARGFTYHRRVQFADTDLAGLVHFSMFFRYMEEAEHALWRAAGLTIARAGETTGWPRLAASFEFRAPLRFEDEFDVYVTVAHVTRKTIEYVFRIERGEITVGEGRIKTAFVSKPPDEPMTILELPADIIDRLRAAAGA